MALVLGSLLPVLSHAMVARAAEGQGWVQVCTVTGMAWVQQADTAATETAQTSPDAPDSSMNMGSCNWCATHAPAAGLPPVVLAQVAPVVWASSVPAAFLQSPRPLFVWASAQSRAPPTAS